MKGEMDHSSYNNEFKDLQVQLYAITNEQFNRVSLFANYRSQNDTEGSVQWDGLKLMADHTISIHTSLRMAQAEQKVSLHKAMLRVRIVGSNGSELAGSSAGTATTGLTNAVNKIDKKGAWTSIIHQQAVANAAADGTVTEYGGNTINSENKAWVTLAAPSLGSTIGLDQISVELYLSPLWKMYPFLQAEWRCTDPRHTLPTKTYCEDKHACSTWPDGGCGYCRKVRT